jgi:hypothetical protein
MANICKNRITVIGLKEEPGKFVKALSKLMFGIDLDEMDPKRWGEDPNIDGRSWYSRLLEEYLQEGVSAARYCVIYPREPYNRLGVKAPCFYVETKNEPPVYEFCKASKVFPELTFHLSWWVMQDGPAGESVIKNGKVVELMERRGSWYLFDSHVVYPTVSLLPAHLPCTLAERGAMRIEDAIDIIRELRGILEDSRFTRSSCQNYRDPKKLEQTRQALNVLLEQMQSAAKQLTFAGVFINDPRCRTLYDHDEKSPSGPVGDYERRANEALAADAGPKAAPE